MKFDFDEAVRALGFDEKRLIETSNILLESYDNDRNVFSLGKETCESILPEGVERGSKDYACYLLFMGIADIFTKSDKLFADGRLLYKEHPEVFDPSKAYEMDKGKLKIAESKRGRTVFAPKLDKIISEHLGHGFHKSISGKWHQTARKLHRIYDGDPRKIFDGVTDFPVAMRRIDVNKPRDLVEREARGTNRFRFGGFGRKTGPLLIMWYVKHGFIKDMDRYQMNQPIDIHAFNLLFGREITNIDEEIRKEVFTQYAQELLKRTFKENEIDPIKFQESQWDVGSKICGSNDCYGLTTENGKERLCPFPTRCKYSIDPQEYRLRGVIKRRKKIYGSHSAIIFS